MLLGGKCGVCYADYREYRNGFIVNGVCRVCRELLVLLGTGQKDTLPEIGRQSQSLSRRMRNGEDSTTPTDSAREPAPLLDKAELRRYFGLVPGQPARHGP
jgi:hypothetical protein